jgi:hypothetical protein
MLLSGAPFHLHTNPADVIKQQEQQQHQQEQQQHQQEQQQQQIQYIVSKRMHVDVYVLLLQHRDATLQSRVAHLQAVLLQLQRMQSICSQG